MEIGFGTVMVGLICLLVFWFARRHVDALLDEHDIEASPTRKLLALTMALAAALCVGKLLEWLFG